MLLPPPPHLFALLTCDICATCLLSTAALQVGCGAYHTACIAAAAAPAPPSLWVWGDGDAGQLGLGSVRALAERSSEIPGLIGGSGEGGDGDVSMDISGVKATLPVQMTVELAAAAAAAAAETTTDGGGGGGRAADGADGFGIAPPVDVACGGFTTVAADAAGRMWVWGCAAAADGEDATESESRPRRARLPLLSAGGAEGEGGGAAGCEGVRRVSAGGYFTAGCTAALPPGAAAADVAADADGWLRAITAAGRHRNYTAAFAGFAPAFMEDARAVCRSNSSGGGSRSNSSAGGAAGAGGGVHRERARSFDGASDSGGGGGGGGGAAGAGGRWGVPYARSNSFTASSAASLGRTVGAKLRAVSAWVLPAR
jgi:hypothetical protein